MVETFQLFFLRVYGTRLLGCTVVCCDIHLRIKERFEANLNVVHICHQEILHDDRNSSFFCRLSWDTRKRTSLADIHKICMGVQVMNRLW